METSIRDTLSAGQEKPGDSKDEKGKREKVLNVKRCSVSHFYVGVFYVVGMNGAEALQGGGGERDAG